MVFGDLVGGMLIRAGERSNERRLREQELADWQRNTRLQLGADFMARNYENMTPEQQESWWSQYGPDVGMKPQQWSGLIGGARAIHSLMPQPAAPTPFGPTAVEPTGQAIHQTAIGRGDVNAQPPMISQVPQVPSIAMAGTPGHTVRGPSITPAEMIEQRKFDQAQRAQDLERQRRISQIMASSMSLADKAMAIKALDIPAGILAAQERDVAGASSVGLNVMQLVSPDGTRKLDVQPTRTGQYVESGSGRIINPAEVAGWTKRYVMSPYMYTTPESQVGFVNREEIARTGGGNLGGVVPGTRVAEPHTATTDEFGNITGVLGTRSGQVGPVTTAPGGPPAANLRKGPMATTELNVRTAIDQSKRNLAVIQEIFKRRKDLIGQWDYNLARLSRGAGMQKDPDANRLVKALNQFADDLIRIKEGAVVPPAMYARLESIVGPRGWTNEQQFEEDLNNAIEVVNVATERRGMETMPKPQRDQQEGGAQYQDGQILELNGVRYKKVPGGLQKIR